MLANQALGEKLLLHLTFGTLIGVLSHRLQRNIISLENPASVDLRRIIGDRSGDRSGLRLVEIGVAKALRNDLGEDAPSAIFVLRAAATPTLRAKRA